MRLAFFLDPLVSLEPSKDSSIAMMRAAQAAGHEIWALTPADLYAVAGKGVCARLVRLALPPAGADWFVEQEKADLPLRDFDAVLMRKDPPFDNEYLAATWLLERAEAEGARVFNRPQALRDHSEKLSLLEFPDLCPPTLVARDARRINTFIDAQGETILKPLDGMGGRGIFRVRHDDPNRHVIIETITQNGQRTIMAQKFIADIVDGDKRILIIGGQIVPFALARIPKSGESRGNLAVGGTGIARPLRPRDRMIAETLAAPLFARGLLLVGIDVIGDWLTEINVTSPTCMVEICSQTGFDAAALFVRALETACAAPRAFTGTTP